MLLYHLFEVAQDGTPIIGWQHAALLTVMLIAQGEVTAGDLGGSPKKAPEARF